MNFINWCNHLDYIKDFQDNYYQKLINEYDEDEIIFNFYNGYMMAISEDLVGEEVGDIYYGENSNFWVDYLVEDFLDYGYCLVPIIVQDNRDIPEIESELDYNQGIRLSNKEELFNFITTGVLPNRDKEPIQQGMAIRRNIEHK